MKSLLSWLVLIVSIAVLVSSCAKSKSSEDSSSADPEVFVATDGNGDILRSTDNGSTFDNVTSPTANHLRGSGFGNNTFVAGGNSGNIVRSTDNG